MLVLQDTACALLANPLPIFAHSKRQERFGSLLEILGVERDTSQKDIEAAHKKKAKTTIRTGWREWRQRSARWPSFRT